MAARFLVRATGRTRTGLIKSVDLCSRILVLLEWMLGYGLGRPCSIHDEE